jgi:hypothetical protein
MLDAATKNTYLASLSYILSSKHGCIRGRLISVCFHLHATWRNYNETTFSHTNRFNREITEENCQNIEKDGYGMHHQTFGKKLKELDTIIPFSNVEREKETENRAKTHQSHEQVFPSQRDP